MMKSRLLCLTLVLGVSSPGLLPSAEPAPEAGEFFEKRIRPVLIEACYKCHSAEAKKLKGGLRLDSRAGLLKGGDTGPTLVAGHPEKSKLIEAISYRNSELLMPPRGKLDPSVIADLTKWVEMGAPWPGSLATSIAGKDAFDLEKRKREHWAWQPVGPSQPPLVRNASWARGPVDQFLLARLEHANLMPAPPADRRTWLRRVTFDLIGLPPTIQEINAFVSDQGPEACERVVDRLLASPHFGERWGRHWLDLVRYGETRGHEFDPVLPNAYQFRDYVIRALNADVPYNEFVIEHLAGDLLPAPRLHPTEKFNESILGTGFWLLGEEVHSPVDIRQDQADRFDNRLDVMTKTFLGLTVACARCHDHKFDAISSADYYSLFGFLESSNYRLARFDSMEHNLVIGQELESLKKACQKRWQTALARRLKPTIEHLSDYLLAARDGLRIGPEMAPKDHKLSDAEEFSIAYRDKLKKLAGERRLEPAVLTQWIRLLLTAGREPDHWLYPWAKAAVEGLGAEGKPLAEGLRPIVNKLKEKQASAEKALRDAEIVIDYARASSADWMPDGPAFGTGPVQAGSIRQAGTSDNPQTLLEERTAARYERLWDVLTVAPGTQKEPGALGRHVPVRAGRTLRTPTITLHHNRVHFLVRGKGMAYAAVSGHVMIDGPLHGELVVPIQTGPDFRWVSQELGRYQGLRAHLEFTAAPGSDFAVAMVVQGPQAPTLAECPDSRIIELLATSAATPQSLARGYQTMLENTASGTIDPALGPFQARILNSLLGQPQLLLAKPETTRQLEAIAAEWSRERQKLADQVQRESRLALAFQDGNGVDGNVFIRGSPKAPGQPVQRRFLAALAGGSPLANGPGSGRLQLARQITDPALNPFITRVFVNRVWHHLFGQGIVASVDNFGFLGERPTHPELLDYLADQFVRDGWSVKKLIRVLALSSAYRMSSQADNQAEEVDPQNQLLHRMRVRRLEGEAIRDALLDVSGRLDPRMGGPSVPIYLTPFLDGRGRPGSGPLDGNGRRSIYLAITRNFLSPLMLAFDTPIPFSTVGRRTVSNVPAQALILLNDPFVHQQTELWGRRVAGEKTATGARIDAMYLTAFGRAATAQERKVCEEFLQMQAHDQKLSLDNPAAWIELAHTLVNVKEFIYLY